MNKVEVNPQPKSLEPRKFRRIPGSTYRLQMHRRFGFSQVRSILPYLSRLGITECYTSPIFKASPGSTHGYDITDPNVINPEMGSESDYTHFNHSIQELRMGHLLDFVPNHMGINPESNQWWRDVLENGPSSPFAHYFDIDWSPLKPELKNKVLLPILSDQYGAMLERGELQLTFNDGALLLRVGDQLLPLNPRQTPEVLKLGLPDLEYQMNGDPALREYLSILTALSNLPAIADQKPSRIEERQREKEVARERLAALFRASEPIRRHILECVRVLNGEPGKPESFNALHQLLEAQAYRLASWKTASHEINYRRFFDINQLAALRMEWPEVFRATHRRLLELISAGNVTGLRLDHPDGLYDPAGYFETLQAHAGPLYVVAEKILSAGEYLRKTWDIDGTSGYDFLNLLSHLFIDSRNAQKLKDIYERFTGRAADGQEEMYRCKKLIMSTSMASELNVLAHSLNRISETNRRWRDFTLDSLRDALREVVACFPVYRTYIRDGARSPSDDLIITKAVASAKALNPAIESSIFDFIRSMLAPQRTAGLSTEDFERHLEFAMKFQQYTAPVQAKGVEDTAFYRYNVLLSLNEVGGDLTRFGISVTDFHQANEERQRDWPHSLLATETHDTKHGEDARMRLNVLSEIPEKWEQAVFQWATLNRTHKTLVQGRACPDPNDEYLFYQALLSAWEPHLSISDQGPLLVRLRQFMVKAIREAKRYTSWIRPNEEYETATLHFLDAVLSEKTGREFLSSFQIFARRISTHGAQNSLAQLVLKMAAPGVPDFYQGCELWDWSFVDPDNRRPIDFEIRLRWLNEFEWFCLPVKEEELPERRETLNRLYAQWEDGKIKLLLTMMGLRFRSEHAELFAQGTYLPLTLVGEEADHAIAFARQWRNERVIVIAPRLLAHFQEEGSAWDTTYVQLPPTWNTMNFRNLFTGEPLRTHLEEGTPQLSLAEVFSTLPVAWISP